MSEPSKHSAFNALLIDDLPEGGGRRTTGGRRRKEKKPLSRYDGRARRGLGRDCQWNTKITQKVWDMSEDYIDRFDLTKAEWTERAFILLAEYLEKGENLP